MATNPLLHRETVECSILFLESGIPALDLCTAPSMNFIMRIAFSILNQHLDPKISTVEDVSICLYTVYDTVSTLPMYRTTVLRSINVKIERIILWRDSHVPIIQF